MISQAVAQILKQHRDSCNRWYAEARHRYPHLDAEAFGHFLQEDASALLQQVEQQSPAALPDLLLQVYAYGLQLAGLRWCGRDSQFPLLQDVWRYWLPHWSQLIVQGPQKALIAITHALRQLQEHPGADTQRWLQQMSTLATLYDDLESWLQAGQVQAWQCGLAHYRQSALQQADFLPEIPLLFALDAAHLLKWPSVRAHYMANRWWTPKRAPEPMTERCRVGGLVGMGGSFTALPQVFALHESLYVSSGELVFELFADAYGASLQRVQDVALQSTPADDPDIQFVRNRLQVDGVQRTLSDLNTITSVACTQDTVAVTSAESFQVILFCRRGDSK